MASIICVRRIHLIVKRMIWDETGKHCKASIPFFLKWFMKKVSYSLYFKIKIEKCEWLNEFECFFSDIGQNWPTRIKEIERKSNCGA